MLFRRVFKWLVIGGVVCSVLAGPVNPAQAGCKCSAGCLRGWCSCSGDSECGCTCSWTGSPTCTCGSDQIEQEDEGEG